MISNSQTQRVFSLSKLSWKNSAWGVFFSLVLLEVFVITPAQAATFTVNNPLDVVDAAPGNGVCETAPGNGVCTLRAAIEETNALAGDDTIILPPNTYLLTQVTELIITRNLTITGSGAATTVIDGNRSVRPDSGVLGINSGAISGAIVNISGVTIRNGGRTTGGGGGILNIFFGTVTLTNCTVSDNSTSDRASGGGILNSSALMTLINSTVSGNSGGFGGGIYHEGGTLTLTNSTVSGNTGGLGGGILNIGFMTVTNSTVSGNTGSDGGGINNRDRLTLTNSTVSGNTGGLGGGIHNFAGTVTLINSTVSGNTGSEGGGIRNSGFMLTLTNSTVSGNTAMFSGGGISNGGGTLTLTNTTVSGNSSNQDGGGIFTATDSSTINVINSTITNNHGNSGRFGGGIYHGAGTLILSNSTVNGNTGGSGGGIANDGKLTLTNSTVSGNSANGEGGGIYNFVHQGTGNLFNSTITNNHANADFSGNESGGGLFNGGPPATINFQNSIIAGNFSGVAVASDCGGTINSNGFNLMGTTMLCTINGSGVTVADPLLGALQNNGGPTQTHALLAGSPAIDAGNPGGCRDNLGALLTTDQRGFPRPGDGNQDNVAACDIGAYELFITGSTSVVAAILPSSRSVKVGVAATAFATIINTGQAIAAACSIAPLTSVPATFQYQTTDPATNQVIGFPNTAANIAPGAAQTFVFAVTPTAPFPPTDVQFSFDCANTDPAPINTGLNTLLLSASNTPVPDIVALAATTTNDGIVNIPGINGTGAFAVATVNVGATGTITASADTGSATLPVNISLCQTNPATAQCISVIGSSVTTQIAANATPTFAIFVEGSGNVPFDPAANRIFVRFRDSGSVTRGSTSVAVRTQ